MGGPEGYPYKSREYRSQIPSLFPSLSCHSPSSPFQFLLPAVQGPGSLPFYFWHQRIPGELYATLCYPPFHDLPCYTNVMYPTNAALCALFCFGWPGLALNTLKARVPDAGIEWQPSTLGFSLRSSEHTVRQVRGAASRRT